MSSVTIPGGLSGTDNQERRRAISSRLAVLANAIESARGATSSFGVRQVMLAVGATSMGLGIVAIVLGWYGAAHSAYLFQEIPYLISGGLLGVALVAGGGFVFFASWFVRLLEDAHRNAARLEQTLERVDHVLGAVVEDAAFWDAIPDPQRRSSTRTTGNEARDTPSGRHRRGSESASTGDNGAGDNGAGDNGDSGGPMGRYREEGHR